jgi:hypothetical protein
MGSMEELKGLGVWKSKMAARVFVVVHVFRIHAYGYEDSKKSHEEALARRETTRGLTPTVMHGLMRGGVLLVSFTRQRGLSLTVAHRKMRGASTKILNRPRAAHPRGVWGLAPTRPCSWCTHRTSVGQVHTARDASPRASERLNGTPTPVRSRPSQ